MILPPFGHGRARKTEASSSSAAERDFLLISREPTHKTGGRDSHGGERSETGLYLRRYTSDAKKGLPEQQSRIEFAWRICQLGHAVPMIDRTAFSALQLPRLDFQHPGSYTAFAISHQSRRLHQRDFPSATYN